MSKPELVLRRQVRELHNLLDDLVTVEKQSTSLDDAVFAPRTLGKDVRVTRWVLVEHFLFTFVEWAESHDRFLRYFGTPGKGIRKNFTGLRMRGGEFGEKILAHHDYKELPNRFRDHWLDNENVRDGFTDAEELYYNVVNSDLRSRVARMDSWLTSSLDSRTDDSAWQHLASDLEKNEARLVDRIRESDEKTQQQFVFSIRNYRRSTLRMSWLESDGVYSRVLDKTRKPVFWDHLEIQQDDLLSQHPQVKQMITGLSDDEPLELWETVGRVVDRIGLAVREIGYQAVFEDINDSRFRGGDDSLLGSGQVTIIPKKKELTEYPVHVAVSHRFVKGRPRTPGFGRIIEHLKEQLDEQDGTAQARVVIFLCDDWNEEKFETNFRGTLLALQEKGVRFLFLWKAGKDTSLQLLPVDLS